MLVTKNKFLSYQNTFFQKIQNTPYKIQLEVVTIEKTSVEDDEFSLEDFVGDNPRTSKFYELRALYEKQISDRTREKYGLPDTVDGIVYLSPKQLVPLFGDYHLDLNRTKIHFEGSTQVISKIIYLEEFKEYGTCIGLQIFVKDDIKGG